MRLLPEQIAMYQLCGEWLPFVEPDQLSLGDRLKSARNALVEMTGQDFGYSLQKWHEYLVENSELGYCWSNKHRSILVRIRKAEVDPSWLEAIALLEKQ